MIRHRCDLQGQSYLGISLPPRHPDASPPALGPSGVCEAPVLATRQGVCLQATATRALGQHWLSIGDRPFGEPDQVYRGLGDEPLGGIAVIDRPRLALVRDRRPGRLPGVTKRDHAAEAALARLRTTRDNRGVSERIEPLRGGPLTRCRSSTGSTVAAGRRPTSTGSASTRCSRPRSRTARRPPGG